MALPNEVRFIRFGGGAATVKYNLFKSIPLLAIAKYGSRTHLIFPGS